MTVVKDDILFLTIIICFVCVCAQSRLTLCNPMDCNWPGSSVHEILWARIVEWVAISYSRGSSQSRDQTRVSCVSCVGRQILYHCATWEALFEWSGSRSVMSDSLRPLGLYSPWSSPGQNTGVGSLSLLQGIFPTQVQTQVSCIAGRFFTN